MSIVLDKHSGKLPRFSRMADNYGSFMTQYRQKVLHKYAVCPSNKLKNANPLHIPWKP